MALVNFPNSPAVGTIYIFNAGLSDEKGYIFKAGQSGTAVDGYWGTYGSTSLLFASALEINDGVVSDKLIAPDQLELSKYNISLLPYKTKLSMAGVGFDHYGTVAPAGALSCDGAQYLKTSYPELYNIIGDVYATVGGQEPPAVGYFRVPIQHVDGYGLFNRGVGAENGGVGTYQVDILKSHRHLSQNQNNVSPGIYGLPASWSDDYAELTTVTRPETRPRSLTVLKCIWTGK